MIVVVTNWQIDCGRYYYGKNQEKVSFRFISIKLSYIWLILSFSYNT